MAQGNSYRKRATGREHYIGTGRLWSLKTYFLQNWRFDAKILEICKNLLKNQEKIIVIIHQRGI